MIFPIPPTVIPRPPNICVASSAVSRPEREMNLQVGQHVKKATRKISGALFKKCDGPCQLIRLLRVVHLQSKRSRQSKEIRAVRTHVVHLVRDTLHPRLTRLHALDHQRQFGADDGLRMERLLERDPLIRPSVIDDQHLAEVTKHRQLT